MSKVSNRKASSRSGTALIAAIFAISLIGSPVIAAGGGSGGGMAPTPRVPRTQIDVEQSYRDGVAALQAKDYKTAEKKFGEVLRVTKKHPEANYYMGLAKIGRSKEKASLRYFKRAIKERDDFVEAREQLALTSIKLDKPDDASEQLVWLSRLKENCGADGCDADFMARIDVAVERIQVALGGASDGGEEGSAISSDLLIFADGVIVTRDAGVERYGEAVRLINQERYDTAIDKLYIAQAIVGPHPDILNYLGYTHRKLGEFDKAQGYYAQALHLDPNHLGATEYLGELYLELGEMKKAHHQLAKLDELCAFGCAEREDLARLITIKETVRSARR